MQSVSYQNSIHALCASCTYMRFLSINDGRFSMLAVRERVRSKVYIDFGR
jgi:hypothetical protein